MRCAECGLEADELSAEWPPFSWCEPCWKSLRKRAWKIYNAHRREGLLIPPTECESCGKEGRKMVGHHVDYRQPLNVEWLCESCHGKAHRERTKEVAGSGF